MYVLGLNAFHADSSACLLRDGDLVAAAEEERFRRIKHWAGFPSQAIRYCLQEAGISLADVDHIGINQNARVHLGRKLGYALSGQVALSQVLERIRHKRRRAGMQEQLDEAFAGDRFAGQVHYIEHHLAHLSSAFHVSPFDEAVVLSVDGFGDFASSAWGIGNGVDIRIDGRVHFPHSLGTFYHAVTQFLGFSHYGDEYKVMGLAPYGRPELLDQMRQIVELLDDGSYRLNLRYFRHHRDKVDYHWDGGEPYVGQLYSDELASLLGPPRLPGDELTQHHKDIAHSVQAMYEEALFHLLGKLHARYGTDSIAIAGGCGMNSVANGKIRLRTPFRQTYVQSAAGDAGGAIGAAFSIWHSVGGEPARTRGAVHDHAYWGPEFSDEQIAELLARHRGDIEAAGCTVRNSRSMDEVCREAAALVADGLVVGWFQGRMEWGPRALGNRSILCDPRRADMKDILNLKIKRRESFRPFAPSVLKEHVQEWFEQSEDVPFMMQVYQIREAQRSRIPAVAHVDGSGRLQTVLRHTNPHYHALISTFQELTGVPMVLNTSFNENEPVVCQPSEALDCFLRTRMDALVLGSHLIRRQAAPA